MTNKLLDHVTVVLWVAVLVVACFPFAALGVKWGLWHFRTGFLIIGGLAITGALLFLIGGFAFLLAQKYQRLSEKNTALVSILLLILPLGFLVSNALKAGQVPFIHDISTDLVNPPTFTHAPSIRGEVENSLEIDPEVAELQKQGYPDIKSMTLTLDQEASLKLIKQALPVLGWRQTYENNQGIIEATDESFWFGFVDDIVIRVQTHEGETRVDMRSVSRVGKSDLGKNAERIRQLRTFLEKGGT